jgi:hypothetical protein
MATQIEIVKADGASCKPNYEVVGYALVDDDDAWTVMAHRWRARQAERNLSPYVIMTGSKKNGGGTLLHNFLMGNPPSGHYWDHIDRDGLNNQRSNLRLATESQNQANRGRQKNNTSGYKGVSWHKRVRRYYARVGRGQEEKGNYQLGIYSDPVQAARVYNVAASLIYGPFAVINPLAPDPEADHQARLCALRYLRRAGASI